MSRDFIQSSIVILLFFFSLLTYGNVSEQTKNDTYQPIYQSVNFNESALPTLSVKYEIRNGTQKEEWFLDRKINVISTFNGHSQQGEIWTRDLHGDIEYSRVFVNDKKIVEYTTGELKTQNKFLKWNQLASIFAPNTIARFKVAGKKNQFGEDVLVLEGEINNIQTTIWWIPRLQIPSYVSQKQGMVDFSITLQKMYKETPISWKWTNQATFENFSIIDASDIGDMENDPFIKKLLQIDEIIH